MSRTTHRFSLFGLTLFLLFAGLLSTTSAFAAEPRESYGYFRTLDGSATVFSRGESGSSAVEINQPLLSGDHVRVAPGSRLEVVLPDRTRVRIDGGSEVEFEALAGSADRSARSTQLRLFEGEIQVEVDDDTLGRESPEIATDNATIYLDDLGTYRISADPDEWTELIVRSGRAEVETDRDAVTVRAQQMATVEGTGRRAVADVSPARGRDALERWADVLEQEDADRLSDRYVDEDLRYAASPLRRHGVWITVEGRSAWRPHVDRGWRPYWRGRWQHTPSGATWVSYEPWGWAPYHYGTWDQVPSVGWVWFPGRVYSPAWVYWYWGPSHVGWCPTGYYTRWYGRAWGSPSFRWGVHGWAGGSWNFFADWNFVPCRYFGGRDAYRYSRPGREWGSGVLARGVITTDTRAFPRERWNEAERGVEIFSRGRDGRGALPDVSEFVARKRNVPNEVRRVVTLEQPGDAVLGTPVESVERGRGRSERGDRRDGGGYVDQIDRRGRDSSGGARSGGDSSDVYQDQVDRPSSRSPRTGGARSGGDSSEPTPTTPPATSERRRPRSDDGRGGRDDSPYVGQPAPAEPPATSERRRPRSDEGDSSRGRGDSPYAGQPAPADPPVSERPRSSRRDGGSSESERPIVIERRREQPQAPASPPPTVSRERPSGSESSGRGTWQAPAQPSGGSEGSGGSSARSRRSSGEERGSSRGSDRRSRGGSDSSPSSGEASPPPGS